MRNVEENVCGCPLGLDLDLDLRRKNFITGSLPFTLFVSDLVEMGVGGLTTFVDDNNHLLTDHRLHDTRVVVDGNNLYHFLYFYYRIDFRYGGNLNDFAECVFTYFTTLRTCNIEPYVVFDGAYAMDDSKLRTVMKRAKDKIVHCKSISRGLRGKLIPALAYDVFKNMLNVLSIKHATCMFEADDQIAALANAWNCPVMSNDSDFFIFDLKGGFIVFDYVNLQVLRDEMESDASGDKEKYNYLSVQIYFTKNLIEAFPSLDKSMLPLFACLYGNDVVHRQYFEGFYAKASFPNFSNLSAVWSSPGRKHHRILKLLLWLDNASCRDHAMDTVLKYIPVESKVKRGKVRELMSKSIASYTISEGYLGKYFTSGETEWLSEIVPEDNGKPRPFWFFTDVCGGKIHTFLLNVVFKQRGMLRCQIEDVKLPSAYRCSLPLRQVAYSICNNKTTKVVEFDRDGMEYRRYAVDILSFLPSGRDIPKLDAMPELSIDDRFAILVEAFGIENEDAIKNVDNQLVLLVLTTAYWVKNAVPPVNEADLYSLIICIMKIALDIEIKPDTSRAQCNPVQVHFLHKWLNECEKDALEDAWINLQSFNKVSSSSVFHVKNIHTNAQYQGILMAALELNSLLQDIVPPLCPSHIMCGTFIYNIYRALHSRTTPKLYLEHLLGRSTHLLATLDMLVNTIFRFLPEKPAPTPASQRSRKRRKAKRKSKTKIKTVQETSSDEDSDEASINDMSHLIGNKFSLLALHSS